MITHLLDTSALLAHYFGESGADEVNNLWREPGNRIGICVLTLPELKMRLRVEVKNAKEVDRVFNLYTKELAVPVIVNRKVALTATILRENIKPRLPLIDAVIAACAKSEKAILVHRDRHMATIPNHLVNQIYLPIED